MQALATAKEPLTKQLREGRLASASSSNRSVRLPVTVHRWRWPMTCTNELGLARARDSEAVGLVGGKGFSCYLRQRGGGERMGEEKSQKPCTCDTWSSLGGTWLALGRNRNFLR